MTRLSPGDEDLHHPTDPTLHRWEPPGLPDPDRDSAWLARLTAHVNAHRAREPFGYTLGDDQGRATVG